MSPLVILVVVLVFALLILVHEFGHFLAARRSGVRVEEFGLGFPPRLWGVRRGQTLYSVNLIPLGGFVRLYGEEGEGRGESSSFASKPPGVKARILIMGVAMNLALAYLLIVIMMLSRAPLMVGSPSDYPFAKVTDQYLLITQVERDSPAEMAGLKVGTVLRRVEGLPIGS